MRCEPSEHTGTGALVLAGSSGRVDEPRARLLADHGVLAESLRWFGGPGQHEGPWEIALELFVERVRALRAECDRVVVLGTSFGAEAALLTGALAPDLVDAVVALAPSDVVWAGVRPDGRQTSHWTWQGEPLPFVALDEEWEPDEQPPAYDGAYRAARLLAGPERLAAAAIPAERVREIVLVAGGDDRVWPSVEHAEAVVRRRAASGLDTTLVTDPEAGHRTVLPGEPVVTAGRSMQRGGTQEADRRLGQLAWREVLKVLAARR